MKRKRKKEKGKEKKGKKKKGTRKYPHMHRVAGFCSLRRQLSGGNLPVHRCWGEQVRKAGGTLGVLVLTVDGELGWGGTARAPTGLGAQSAPGAQGLGNGFIRDLDTASGCRAHERYPVAGTPPLCGYHCPKGGIPVPHG